MSTSHVHNIVDALGADAIVAELGLTEFSIRAAKRDGLFPARWYRPLKALCAASGVECPEEAFRWLERDKKNVTAQESFHDNGKRDGAAQ